jgi:hypothetical protein
MTDSPKRPPPPVPKKVENTEIVPEVANKPIEEPTKPTKMNSTPAPLIASPNSLRQPLRTSSSVDALSNQAMEPVEVDSGDGSLMRRIRRSFLPGKFQNQHKSIELLHTRQLTSKNLELFEEGSQPKLQKNDRQSNSFESGIDRGNSPLSMNISEHTGYRSGRSASTVPNIETKGSREKVSSSDQPLSATAPYSAMTGLRNTRISAMQMRANSKLDVVADLIGTERERSKSATPSIYSNARESRPLSSKLFKEWYLQLIHGIFD